mmetsp:Transcript_60093/g.130536  ORF Transcript_60093/g.130536 Transcript_60093/m.130536 type:complete len:259 (+) Transcript_60093:1-777(+)
MALAGQTALVTGGGSGLGEAAAEKLHQLGANIFILDRDEEAMAAVQARLGARVGSCTCDVTSADDVGRALDQAEGQFGKNTITILVNSAGVGGAAKTLDRKSEPFPLDFFETLIKVNLIGTFNVARLAAQRMAKAPPRESGQRGVIINVASVAAYEGQMGQVGYSASKGGVVSMTLPMARDLGSFGIRVVTIAPGIFDTPMMQRAPDKLRASLENQCLAPKRLGHAGEFGHLVTSIVQNTYLNATVIRLDAGIRMAAL